MTPPLVSISISRGPSSPRMEKEFGMAGWPTKTFAINTIDPPLKDVREVEEKEAEGGEKIEANRRHLEALCIFVPSGSHEESMLNQDFLR